WMRSPIGARSPPGATAPGGTPPGGTLPGATLPGATLPGATNGLVAGLDSPCSASLVTEDLADRVHHRVELPALLGRGGSGRGFVQILLHAVILFPPLQGELEVDLLPLGVAALHQRLDVRRHD